jgi:hypothetical protein
LGECCALQRRELVAATLGIDITVAVKWQRAAAGDWATYAADVSRRTTKENS